MSGSIKVAAILLVCVPLIPGYNTEEDRAQTVTLLRGMGFTRFDLFTYHLPERKKS